MSDPAYIRSLYEAIEALPDLGIAMEPTAARDGVAIRYRLVR